MLEATRNMTKIFTIGVNGKSSKQFFEILKNNRIELVIDIRLNNKSQLAGFAKGGDDYLGYLLKEICRCEYMHDPYFAPTKEILDDYHLNNDWDLYVQRFNKLIKKRGFKEYFAKKYTKYGSICFLCAEKEADHCHRRLIAESIGNNSQIIHL